MSVIFESSTPGRINPQHATPLEADEQQAALADLPEALLRQSPTGLPEVSELEVVRHYTKLSQKNYSIDTHFYPLGSCTMKYNPRAANKVAMLPGFLGRHPLDDPHYATGLLHTLFELQEMLREITGMAAISLAPMAGAQGEFAGVAMIRAYHDARGDSARREILVPDASHGTNPATATMCGYVTREVPTNAQGDVDIEALKSMVGPQTAGLMLTNPSTLGVFERSVGLIARIIHDAGGLLYYDGANLNAIAGRVRPGEMGFDAIHINVHKTFATPHGGGGPGAGPVGVSARLQPFLPIPRIVKQGASYALLESADCPQSIGRMGAFGGNIGVLLRAHAYLCMIGRQGVRRVGEYATLNANYLLARLTAAGFKPAYAERRATHEFIITLKAEADAYGLTALNMAKRLLDYGFYAPTIYFPLLVPECLLIEPTETESPEQLDAFVAAMVAIRKEAQESPEFVKNAPYTTPVRRLDETRAARKPDLIWRGPLEQ
ncbi:glycine dehydrogenase (decarboxylating) beta subunit [Magnetococcus marinus MC-1]|uniref:Probable glycine dehydrogenase (decarboxylating) subunit 2 n=1 Tax=Magnetococcus marinus (strain ATCC BAA-1437 / JCM 17883 / MC-1) TaxID=156889 RepID=A0L7X7_MAGMM|nr:aminomethyl-transferring glycine dehydrogenase subunit GcvPB [Magnetococcus marinus]ABK44070.1 glycine dehydrogenase (decarboxylating) beta subunit [Magnetococcus marinus MC-1]